MRRFLGIAVILYCFIATPATRETYKDIIHKAQTLTLQQDRLQAAQVLKRAIENESSKKIELELRKALHEVTTIFYSEKGQSIFEYGRSLFRASPLEAQEKLSLALKEEPGNITVLVEQARLSLFLGKCEDAEATTVLAQNINPYEEDAALLLSQAKACLQKTEDAIESLKKTEQSVYAFVVYAQSYLQKGDVAQAQSYLNLAKLADAQFPEIYFWDLQIKKKQSRAIEDSVFQYVKLCKTFVTKDFIKYSKEPRTCQEYKNIEIEFKNLLEAESKKET